MAATMTLTQRRSAERRAARLHALLLRWAELERLFLELWRDTPAEIIEEIVAGDSMLSQGADGMEDVIRRLGQEHARAVVRAFPT